MLTLLLQPCSMSSNQGVDGFDYTGALLSMRRCQHSSGYVGLLLEQIVAVAVLHCRVRSTCRRSRPVVLHIIHHSEHHHHNDRNHAHHHHHQHNHHDHHHHHHHHCCCFLVLFIIIIFLLLLLFFLFFIFIFIIVVVVAAMVVVKRLGKAQAPFLVTLGMAYESRLPVTCPPHLLYLKQSLGKVSVFPA